MLEPIAGADLVRPAAVLPLLDFAGVAVFAATGALAAAREKHDVLTFAFFAAVTGMGGGTLRDLLIGAPVFWVQDWRYVAVCMVAAVGFWMLGARCCGWMRSDWRPMASWGRPRRLPMA